MTLILTITACANPNTESNLVRRAVVSELLNIYQVDDLVIRTGEGELRENFGFQGTTVYLVGPVREKEYWEVRDPARSYIFIGDIVYSSGRTQARAAVEIRLRENDRREFAFLFQKRGGAWEVVSQSET